MGEKKNNAPQLAPSRNTQLYAAAALEGMAIEAREEGKDDDCRDLYAAAQWIRHMQSG